MAWSSPFGRWQGPLAGVSSLDLAAAAGKVMSGAGLQLVVATDVTSNASHLPGLANWVLDSRARDPRTGVSMLETAEKVAAESGITRAELDELAALRSAQYGAALAGDRAFQRRYLVAAQVSQDSGPPRVIAFDDGVRAAVPEEMAALPPTAQGGLHTPASQACPADGAAGALVATAAEVRELASGAGVAHILAVAFARADPGRMPQAPVASAQAALEVAGLSFRQVDAVTTHAPFAVSDIYFSRQTGVAVEKMNAYGCSLVYGHPQGPTGLRSVAELIEELRQRGGGTGVFAGCSAGDAGAAIAVRVDDR